MQIWQSLFDVKKGQGHYKIYFSFGLYCMNSYISLRHFEGWDTVYN